MVEQNLRWQSVALTCVFYDPAEELDKEILGSICGKWN
jgi:hypothetical protein